MSDKNLPTWEVFIQPKTGAAFQHAGSLHASDEEMALQNARELYTRRQEGTCIWVVKTEHIISSSPEDQTSLGMATTSDSGHLAPSPAVREFRWTF